MFLCSYKSSRALSWGTVELLGDSLILSGFALRFLVGSGANYSLLLWQNLPEWPAAHEYGCCPACLVGTGCAQLGASPRPAPSCPLCGPSSAWRSFLMRMLACAPGSTLPSASLSCQLQPWGLPGPPAPFPLRFAGAVPGLAMIASVSWGSPLSLCPVP